MNEERRSTRDSRRPHGIAPDASPGATDPMDRFLTQMLHIDQMRTERDEKRQAEEQTRQEKRDARILQRQTEQDQRMAQIMAEVYGRMGRPVDGPPRGPNLSLQKFQEGTDDMGAFLDTFETTATAGRWPRDQWPLFLRGSLSGKLIMMRSRMNS